MQRATKVSPSEFTLPRLPYLLDALEPHISRETLAYHHGGHHRAYLYRLNSLLAMRTIRCDLPPSHY